VSKLDWIEKEIHRRIPNRLLPRRHFSTWWSHRVISYTLDLGLDISMQIFIALTHTIDQAEQAIGTMHDSCSYHLPCLSPPNCPIHPNQVVVFISHGPIHPAQLAIYIGHDRLIRRTCC
jgi:hypothetical protein